MSASVTLTIRPGSERGAEHVNRENRYPAPPPIIPAPFEYAPDGLPPPIIPDRVGLPEPQPARAKPATAVVSANRVRNTTRRRIHPDATTPEPQERSGKSHASIHGKPVLRRPQTRHADPLVLRAPASERSDELPPAGLASRDPQRAAVLLPPGARYPTHRRQLPCSARIAGASGRRLSTSQTPAAERLQATAEAARVPSSDRRNRSKPAARGGPILASHTAASRLKRQCSRRCRRDRFGACDSVIFS